MRKNEVRRKPKTNSKAERAKRSQALEAPTTERGGFYRGGPLVTMGGVQRKIKVGPANDGFEREANAAADQVAGGRELSTPISRIGGGRVARQEAVGEPAQPQVAQRQPAQDEEPLQRSGRDAVEEPLHGRENEHDRRIVQRQSMAEDETVQRQPSDDQTTRLKTNDDQTIQRQPADEETAQRQPADEETAQRQPADEETAQRQPADEETAQRQPADEETAQRQPADEETAQRQPADEEVAQSQRAQRQTAEDETVQRQPADEETAQRQPADEETAQRQPADDKTIRPKTKDDQTTQPKTTDNQAIQLKTTDAPTTRPKTTDAPTKSGGSPIRPATRQRLESGLGADLSGVRVHEGREAAQAAERINARAFTHGSHIWLGKGESQDNTRLMAHEATHTLQQGAAPAVQRQPKGAAPAGKEKAAAAGPAAGPPEFDLKGMAKLAPPPAVSTWLDGQKKGRGLVPVRFGKIARGTVLIRKRSRKRGDTFHIDRWQPLPLTHPAFSAVTLGEKTLQPSLIVKTRSDGTLTGHIGIPLGKRIPSEAGALGRHLKEAPAMLGLNGFDFASRPKVHSRLAGGALELGVTDVPIKMGSIFSGSFTLTANDERVTTFTGNVSVTVTGLAQGSMDLKRDEKGVVVGKANVDLDLPKNFSGSMAVDWDGQDVKGEGKIGYKGEKLSGSVTLKVMKKSEAEKLEAERKPPAEAESKKKKKKGGKRPEPYAVFGEGDLTFAFTDWLNGTAHVIVDHKGFVTIIGKITPQKEFTLFEQKPYRKKLPGVEARATYGIPVVGNVFIYASIGLEAWAHLGPAKFYNIQVDGEYSTDPQKSKSFSIRGSLNISAAAGLTARGEAGAGLEILDHEIKVGAGVDGTAGIKGYAEATPIIGYREKSAAEGEDKKGEFYIRGDLEIAAQPFLALSGDLFVKLDSPWWSPAPDKTWKWPLGQKEWPIGGSLGLGAEVDYVFGSGKAPAMKLKPAAFDGNKFMTDLVKKKTKPKSKSKKEPGKWKEKNSKALAPPKEAKAGDMAPGKTPARPPAKPKIKPGGPAKPKKGVSPSARTAEGKSVKALKKEAIKKGKKPEGEKPVEKAPKAKKAAKDPARKDRDDKVKKAVTVLDAVTARYARDGASEKEIKAGIGAVRRKHKKVFKSITIVDGGATWDYEYAVNPSAKKKGPKKKTAKEEGEPTAWSATIEKVAAQKAAEDARRLGQTRLVSTDVSLNRKILNQAIDSHSPPGKPKREIRQERKAARRKAFKYFDAAVAATNAHDIYKNMQKAQRVVNELYGKGALDLQSHHMDQVAKNPRTYEKDRKQRIRSRLTQKAKKLPQKERDKLFGASEEKRKEMMAIWVDQMYEEDVELKKDKFLSEVSIFFVPKVIHFGVIHKAEREEKKKEKGLYKPRYTFEDWTSGRF